MKKIFCLFVFLTIAILSIFSQEIIDPEIEDESVEEESSFFDYLNQTFSGTLALARGVGPYGERTNYFFSLQYNQEFTNWLKVVLTGNAYFNSVRLNLRLKEECRRISEEDRFECMLGAGDEPPVEERSITSEENGIELREAYFDLGLGDYALLSVGKKLIAWGQFEIFSPIDIVALPTRFGSLGLTFSKLDARLTQDVAQLNIYPFDGFEVQAYYIPSTSIDPFLEEFLADEGNLSYSVPSTDNPLDFERDYEEVPYSLVDPDDPSQKAVRMLFYPNWGILGLTYHKGFANFPENLAVINDENSNRQFVEENLAYPERDIFGFEIAIPAGRWGWKFEVAYTLNAVSTFELKTRDLHLTAGENNFFQEEVTAIGDLVNWIEAENDNKLYYEYQNILAAFGTDVELDLWKFNLVVFYFDDIYSSEVQEGRALAAELDRVRNKQEGGAFGNVFPSFNIIRYWNENKETKLGWIAGFIPGGIGTSFYFNQEYYESLTFVVALEAVQYFGDFALLDGIVGEQYEFAESLSAGVRAGLLYTF